jgi:hypothetical protein
MQVGIAGVIDLYNETHLVQGETGDSKYKLAIPDAPPGESWPVATVENVTALLTKHRKTVNHTLTAAGDRGTSVHDAFETWCKTGVIPHPEIYPETEKGYVTGLVKFLHDFGPAWDIQAEIMVGSLQHLYAGRYDMRCRWGGGPMVTKTYPVKADKIEELPGGNLMLDLKTSSGVYLSHALQLEAYELASIECGYDPTDYRYVLHVTRDGKYELVRSKATPDDFLAVRACYQALENLKGRKT